VLERKLPPAANKRSNDWSAVRLFLVVLGEVHPPLRHLSSGSICAATLLCTVLLVFGCRQRALVAWSASPRVPAD
jgi:hypothetical protein